MRITVGEKKFNSDGCSYYKNDRTQPQGFRESLNRMDRETCACVCEFCVCVCVSGRTPLACMSLERVASFL